MTTSPVSVLASGIEYMDTAPFWAAAREHRLLLQYCPISGRYQFYPRPGSIFTGRRQLEWREATGKGRLAAWTVDRMAPVIHHALPRIQVYVDLDEGVRLLTWLVDSEPKELTPGMRVQVRWVDLEDGRRWPAFTPFATLE